MATKKLEVEVAEKTHEALMSLAGFAGDLRTALADGWQVGQDLPVVLSSALTKLVPAVSAVSEIKAEVSADRASALRAGLLGVEALVDALTGPADSAPAA